MKKNIKKESKRIKVKRGLARFMFAVMSVTTLTNAGAFPTIFGNPAKVVQAEETNIELATPTNVTVKQSNPFRVVVSWDAVEGASSYRICYTDENGNTQEKKTSSTKKGIYLEPDTTYTYQVSAVLHEDLKFVTESKMSEPITLRNEKIMTPEITNAKCGIRGDGVEICILWHNAPSYMTRHYFYMSTDGVNFEKVYQNGAGTPNTPISGIHLEEGETYYFKMISHYDYEAIGVEHYSDYSEVFTFTVPYKEPKDETPVTEEPTTEEPTTEAPATEEPTTEAPVTEEPTTEEPTTEAPVTEEPTTEAPVTEEPTTEEPTTEEPTTEEPEVELTDEELIKLDGRPQAGNTYEAHMMAYGVMELMNEERVRLGYEPCIVDSRYLQATAIRAQEITISYSHTRPNGQTWYTVFSETGFRPGSAGENLVWGRKSAESFYEAWRRSAGHYRNMTNKNYKYVGVYIYENPENGHFYAALLAGKKN
ncbi:MAG: hypothetical protein J6A25_09945 [Lachnospiraceae bacterium]|nr:hypothetical protein [Lachnospiraceae bacterium]